jgi:flagellar biogenesis protein FliO
MRKRYRENKSGRRVETFNFWLCIFPALLLVLLVLFVSAVGSGKGHAGNKASETASNRLIAVASRVEASASQRLGSQARVSVIQEDKDFVVGAISDLMAVLLEYYKLSGKEAREDAKLSSMDRELEQLKKRARFAKDNKGIEAVISRLKVLTEEVRHLAERSVVRQKPHP